MNRLFTTPDEAVLRGQSGNEWFDLALAWGGTTLAYAILQTGAQNLMSERFLTNLVLAGIVCGLGFVLHELAHRVMARRYGAEAHFVANRGFLLLSIAIAFAGIFIAAPGAVWYRGFINRAQNGQIALAGPVTNYALALIFILIPPLLVLVGIGVPAWLVTLCAIGYSLNAWLGLFNMIPAGPFDGAKVLEWDKVVFGVTVAVGILLSFVLRPDAIWRFLLGA
jgi:Zn-dependent protease